MFKTKRPIPAEAAPLTESRRFLASLGLDHTLPIKLTRHADGRPYQPIQLAQVQKGGSSQTTLVQEMSLLQMKKHTGGWDTLLEGNRVRAEQEALHALEARVSEGALTIPVRPFLQELAQEITQDIQLLQTARATLEQRYAEAESNLVRWQNEQAQGQGLLESLATIAQTLISGRLTRNDAVACWNSREASALSCDAHRAALTILIALAEAVSGLVRALDQVLEAAESRRQVAAGQVSQLRQSYTRVRGWGYEVNPSAIAEVLTQQNDSRWLSELLTALREAGSEALIAQTQTIARREAERLLEGLDIIGLIELEGEQLARRTGTGDAVDALVLVGEELLDQVRRRPTWQLTSGARRRVETLQIVPQGEAIFEHTSLKSAAYGSRQDRLAFLQVEFEVALEELRLVQEGRALFAAAQERREHFVLEEVAAAWRAASTTEIDAPPPRMSEPPPIFSNGTSHAASEAALW
ncbi:MAG: hypothetical protein H0T73_12615 [Ardenticatenales bacterium]|nr:hypothetical protein [Ardenticatenales bacterium]